MSFLRACLLLLFALLVANCWRSHRLGSVSPDEPKCDKPLDCPYGYECSGGACLASECNDAHHCDKGGCTYEDDESANHGWGTCAN